MPELSWNECCKKALSEINECDKFIYFKEPKTVRNWHHKWRIQGESFTNPALIREDGRPSLPPFLDRNPDAKDAIVRHAKAHLHELNVEFLHSYIQKEVLPKTAKKRTEELQVELKRQREMLDRGEEIDFEMTLEDLTDDAIATAKVTVEQLLKESRLRVLSLETVLSWMHNLGFKYETRKAHFYVDSHEKPEVKKYRDSEFIP